MLRRLMIMVSSDIKGFNVLILKTFIFKALMKIKKGGDYYA